MPITPFHFGPGALAHVCAPRAVSFLAFCAANVLIDLESLYHLVLRHWPVHAFWHTLVGASLVWVCVLLAYLGLRAFDRRRPLPDGLRWRRHA